MASSRRAGQRRTRTPWLLPALTAVGLFAACGKERPPFAGDWQEPGGGHADSGTDGATIHIPPPKPPAADASGLCGNLVVPLVVERPNFYFVLDASGSMKESMETPNADGFLPTRYQAAVSAIVNVLSVVGHRVSYGATLFPARTATDACAPGTEVFPVRPGDPIGSVSTGELPPTLDSFFRTIAGRSPSGGTPTAATLEGLKSELLALPGRTAVFLVTDGAPNCNGAATCAADACIANIEGGCRLPAGANCCDPVNGAYDWGTCLDGAPTLSAVKDLRAGGIDTYVVGLPGTDRPEYVTLLDQLATEGGTARSTTPLYYPVSSADDLTKTLQEIGLAVALSCDIALEEPAPDRSLVNVFFDETVVPLDPENGWTWVTDDHIQIVGEACTHLQAGDALQLQIVAGCPSAVL